MHPDARRMANGLTIQEAKIYRPTWEEFKDFNKFVKKIEEEGAAEAGICKVIPPKEWVPRKKGYKIDELDFTIDRPILQRFSAFGERGAYQTKGVTKGKMSISEYYDLCHTSRYTPPAFKSHDDAERKYWKSLMYSNPLYGCDVAAPLSDEGLKEWNISNLGCVLDLVKKNGKSEIKGVLSPYLYFGMWKATFSWHIEDLDLYAINVVHYGAPKTWYCIPPKYGHKLEQLTKKIFPSVSQWCTNFMRHKTCLVSPQVLEKYGIPYQKIVQEEREIIITFPYAYHQGFNHGFNIAESTNFATENWVEFGKRSRPCDCEMTRVQFPMDIFVKKFQPEKYENWINKTDIAPHPMDPPEVAKRVKLQYENPQEYSRLMSSTLSVKMRSSSSQEEKAEHEKNGKKFLRYNVYQHHQLANVLVQYNPETGKIRSGAARLANFFDDPKIPQLIEQGYLIKVGTVKCVSKGHKKPGVLKLKCTEDDFCVNVDAKTLKVIGEPEEKLLDFLKKKKSDLETLFKAGVFKEIIVPNLKPSVQKRVQKRLYFQAFKTKQFKLLKLRHAESGHCFKVFPKTLEPAYRLQSKISNLMKSSSVRNLLTKGILVEEGEVVSQLKQLAKVKISAPATLTCDLYYTSSTNLPVRVTKKGEILLDRGLPHIKELCHDNTSVQNLLASKSLVYSSTRELRRRNPEFDTSSPTETYDPEDLIPDSELIDQFVYENDPDYPTEDSTLKRDRFGKVKQGGMTPVCEETVAKMTRDIVSHFLTNYSDVQYPTFDLTSLNRFSSQADDRKLLPPILDILEDLKMVSQSPESRTSYMWLGRESTDLKEVIWYFLDRRHLHKKEENRQKMVFREVLLLLLETRKGLRVHLKQFGKSKFGKLVDLRRVSFAGGVLRGLDLVEPVRDDLGGAVWIGDDFYLDWSTQNELHHFNAFSVVTLPKIQVESSLNERAVERLRVWLNPPPTEAPPAKQLKVCKCGYKKGVNVITQIRGTVSVRRAVLAGNKRRKRCNACENCLRPPCRTCPCCVKKALKKPCIYRVCSSPQNPDCPCFAT